MAADFTFKAGDTRPDVIITCLDGAGEPVPFSTSDTVAFCMARAGAPVIEAPAEIDPPANNGRLRFRFAEDSTDDLKGEYDAEFTVTYEDGGVETFPNYRDLKLLFKEKACEPGP